MNKSIAIITGASGGLGKEFVRLAAQENIDEIWAVARSIQKLDELHREYGDKIVVLATDLSNQQDILTIKEKLALETPRIQYLINNAGMGEQSLSHEYSLEEIQQTVAVNCTAVVELCQICIPYMPEGSHILNISSQSSFQPVPYINLYAATKAFVRNYSRALHVELKKRKIAVTAVCPGWIQTEMLAQEINGKQVKFPGLVLPDKVAAQAMQDAKKGRDMSVCTLYVKWMHLLSKLFPQKAVMKTWVGSIRKYGIES